MLQGEHSAIFLTFIKLPFVIKIFVLSIFEWPFYTGFTVVGVDSIFIFRVFSNHVVFILTDQMESIATIAQLPVAPPLPRDPIRKYH